MLLLLEQPLVEGLLEQSLRRWLWGGTLSGLRALRWLLRTSYTSSTCITPWQSSHGILLLHLEMVLVLVLKPLLECSCSLLLSHQPWVTLPLLAWGTTRVLRAKRWSSRWALSH